MIRRAGFALLCALVGCTGEIDAPAPGSTPSPSARPMKDQGGRDPEDNTAPAETPRDQKPEDPTSPEQPKDMPPTDEPAPSDTPVGCMPSADIADPGAARRLSEA